MFEKEAEEYARQNNPAEYGVRATHFTVLNSFKDGAEFGYNKVNEWHYVKNGDLPKEFDKPYLCYLNGYFEVGYFMAYKEQPWHFDSYYLDNEDVDAWKEIVLPELPKEE